MIDTNEILKNPTAYRIEWPEPWPGIDENGNDCPCEIIANMTAADAVNFQRWKHKNRPDMDAEALLGELIVTHWAKVVAV